MDKLALNIGDKFLTPFGENGGSTIGDLVSLFLKASFAIAGLVVLFMFLIGGIQMISGAGSDNPESAAKGKKAATSAIVGFMIIFVAYWIMRIIEKMTGSNFITAPGI